MVRTAASIALFACCGLAQAQSSERASSGQWGIGIAAAVNDTAYRDYSKDVLPFPSVSYEGRRMYVRGATIGFRVLGNRASELSLTVAPLGMRFRSEDSDDPQLRQLDNRKLSALAGVAWRYAQPWGVVQASFQKEVTGHGGGTLAEGSYAYPIRRGALTLTPRVGVTRTSGALNDYYYGVSRAEAARSGLDRYTAKGGNSPWLEMSAMQRLGRHWVVGGGMRYTRLADEITDSPMTDKDNTKSFFVSATYLL